MNLENYAVGAELAEKGGFHISNISMLLKEDNMVEGEDFLKFGTITLINMDSPWLPAYIRKVITEHKLTDLTGLIPASYAEEELSEEIEDENAEVILNDEGIEDVQKIPTKNYFSKLAGKYEEVKVAKKKFIKLTDNKLIDAFADDKVRCIMDASEFPESSNDVDGFINLTPTKVLVWY